MATKLSPDGFDAHAVTESMRNGFKFQMTQRARWVLINPSAYKTLLYPDATMHALPHKRLDSRKSVELPYPFTWKGFSLKGINSKEICTL